MDIVVLAAEVIFAIVFLATLADFVRRRDPVRRDVMLIFGTLVALLIVDRWGRVPGGAPAIATQIGGTLFVLQPVFAIHLVSLVRSVPRIIPPLVALLSLGTGLPVLFVGGLGPGWAAAAFTAFIFGDIVAASLILAETRRRRGPSAIRLALAGGGTALFALAILAAVVSAIVRPGAPDAAAALVGVASIGALVAALGYVAAFLPPAWLRRLWAAQMVLGYDRAMMLRPSGDVTGIWSHYAELAAATAGTAVAIIVVTSERAATVILTDGAAARSIGAELRAAGIEPASIEAPPQGDLGVERPAATFGPVVERLAAMVGARFASVAALRTDRSTSVVLVVLGQHRGLFRAADLEMLAALGAPTALIAERQAIVAEQAALADRLARTVAALESAGQAKSDFLASMSHELRTPLSSILGFSELMRAEERVGDAALVPLEWVDHVHRAGEHLLDLINDVLDLAKVEAGRLDLRPESIDIGPAIAEILSGVRPLAERKRLGLRADVPALGVLVDRGRFRQMLYNLLSNAIKFTPDGGRVEVRAVAVDGVVRIEVSDTGIGIAPEDREAVFEEFRQVGDPVDRQPGTGLGLALTRRLVEAHGGRIELESAIGRGSRFVLVLPASEAPAVAAEPEPVDGPAAVRPILEPGHLDGRREILVIEDDPSAVRLIGEYLAPAGVRMRVAPDGERGLAMAAEHPPSAIILDVVLPGLDGWEVLRRLRADVGLATIPVIMVTLIDEREIGLALGAVDYHVKPVGRDTLVASLARFAPAALGGAGGPRAPRVLAVDDDPGARLLIRSALEPEGYEVVEAGDGRDAIERMRTDRIDFVVCDLVMPDIDGFEVVAATRADPATAGIPILVCTSHELSDDDKARLNGRILGVVAKGADAREGLRTWIADLPEVVGAGPAARPD